jgi:hypothetical protein
LLRAVENPLTPVNPLPSPEKLVAVITPETLIPDAVKIPTGDNNCDFV